MLSSQMCSNTSGACVSSNKLVHIILPSFVSKQTNTYQPRHASSAEWQPTRARSEVLKALASEYMLRVATEEMAGTVTASENMRPLVELAEA